MPIMKKTLATKGNMSANTTSSETDTVPSKEGQTASTSSVINIAIETDDGNIQPPEIDEIEEVFREEEEVPKAKTPDCEEPPIRRLSITDRKQKIKLGEDVANSIKIEAQQRKKNLENLLEEHEHLVRKIVSADPTEQTVSH